MQKYRPMIALMLVLLAAGLACNFPTSAQKTPTGPQGTFTALAQTLDVFLTQTAVAGGFTTGTATPGTATATLTAQPSSTQRPANTAVPPTAVPCDSATFVQDVNYPDGTQVTPGQAFTKTWRLYNSGACTWSTSYVLAFDSGTAMNAPSAVNLPGSVPPGQTIDISVSLTAPTAPGTYRANFKLRNPNGATFGIGPYNNVAFWAEIKVVASSTGTATVTATTTSTSTTAPGSTTVYDFAVNYCTAEWVTGAGVIGCPGTNTDSQGFVVKLDNPTLQNGNSAGETAIETSPQAVNDGVISGRFPAITVNNGYHFKSRLSCLAGANNCDVKYQLNYRSDGGSLQSLGEWSMAYSGGVQTIDVDVSALHGHSVEFVLAVRANGAADQDYALWVAPKIVR